MTNEVADELVHKIGFAIGSDPNLYDDWDSISTVFKIDRGVVGEQSTMYCDNNRKIPFLLDTDNEATELILQLQAATINDDGTIWVACKIDVFRETKRVKIKFEYKDEKRWDAPLPF